MALSVVEGLEVIQIDHQQGTVLMATIASSQGLTKTVDQQSPIRQIGEWVEKCEVANLFFGFFSASEIAGDAKHANYKATAVAYRCLDGFNIGTLPAIVKLDPLFIAQWFVCSHCLDIRLAECLGKLLVDKVVVCFPDYLPFRLTKVFFSRRVAGSVNTICIFYPHWIRNGFDQGAQTAALVFEQCRAARYLASEQIDPCSQGSAESQDHCYGINKVFAERETVVDRSP